VIKKIVFLIITISILFFNVLKVSDTDCSLIRICTNISSPTPKVKKIQVRTELPSRNKWEKEGYRELNAIVTFYSPDYSSTGKNYGDTDYGITASGRKAIPYHTVALPKEFPFGTLVIIKDPEFENIVFVNEDRGGAIKIIDDNTIKIDVYMNSEKECKILGKKYCKVYIKEEYYDK
jgi:3D (Asp-Asp-Asp) domain-containing protein